MIRTATPAVIATEITLTDPPVMRRRQLGSIRKLISEQGIPRSEISRGSVLGHVGFMLMLYGNIGCARGMVHRKTHPNSTRDVVQDPPPRGAAGEPKAMSIQGEPMR
jgi:hypothetical protein